MEWLSKLRKLPLKSVSLNYKYNNNNIIVEGNFTWSIRIIATHTPHLNSIYQVVVSTKQQNYISLKNIIKILTTFYTSVIKMDFFF